MEMGNELLSSVGAPDMDTSGYQVSDLDNVEINWENDQLDVFKPGIDTPSHPSKFNEFSDGFNRENPLLIDEDQDMENSPPPHPTTPVSERPTQPPVWMRSRPFGTRIESVPDFV